MRITTLVENTASRSCLLAEHGLAFWIEADGFRLLFDTGQSGVVVHNAERLGIDLATADAVALSHGHYDHSGGLEAAAALLRTKRIYAHPVAFRRKYTRDDPGGGGRFIGMPPASKKAVMDHVRVIPTGVPVEVGGGLLLTGEIPRLTTFEDTGGFFFEDPACTHPDTLPDDQALFFDTPSGLVVVLGCAHSGIVNTLLHIRSLRPERPFRAVVGGMHLVHASELRLERTIQALHDMKVRELHPLHCTGCHAMARLENAFPGCVGACPVGTTLEYA